MSEHKIDPIDLVMKALAAKSSGTLRALGTGVIEFYEIMSAAMVSITKGGEVTALALEGFARAIRKINPTQTSEAAARHAILKEAAQAVLDYVEEHGPSTEEIVQKMGIEKRLTVLEVKSPAGGKSIAGIMGIDLKGLVDDIKEPEKRSAVVAGDDSDDPKVVH